MRPSGAGTAGDGTVRLDQVDTGAQQPGHHAGFRHLPVLVAESVIQRVEGAGMRRQVGAGLGQVEPCDDPVGVGGGERGEQPITHTIDGVRHQPGAHSRADLGLRGHEATQHTGLRAPPHLVRRRRGLCRWPMLGQQRRQPRLQRCGEQRVRVLLGHALNHHTVNEVLTTIAVHPPRRRPQRRHQRGRAHRRCP